MKKKSIVMNFFFLKFVHVDDCLRSQKWEPSIYGASGCLRGHRMSTNSLFIYNINISDSGKNQLLMHNSRKTRKQAWKNFIERVPPQQALQQLHKHAFVMKIP